MRKRDGVFSASVALYAEKTPSLFRIFHIPFFCMRFAATGAPCGVSIFHAPIVSNFLALP